MKKILYLLLLVVFNGYAQQHYTIKGKFTKVKNGKIYLIVNGKPTVTDSSKIINGSFSFRGTYYKHEQATLTYDLSSEDNIFTFYTDESIITCNGEGDSLRNISMLGSKINKENIEMEKELSKINKWYNSTSKIYGKMLENNIIVAIDSIDIVFDEILAEKREIINTYILNHPASIYSAILILENYGFTTDASEVKPLYNVLTKQIKNSSTGRDVKKMLDAYQNVALGKVMPNFTLRDSSGNLISLSQFRGKYVLVDFWASWCAPCRRQNPKLVKTYNNFRNKGFEILGVSFDKIQSVNDWKKAIRDDQLSWTNICEQKSKNTLSDLFYIKGIPTNFLLDKTGKIIAKNLMGEKLSKKLNELL